MARGLSSLPNETLSLILSQFCLHCSRGRNYDSPDGHFRDPRPRDGEQVQDPDEPAWYSHDYRKTLYSMCLVSKRFQSIAQSVLHHEFIPGYGDAWRSTTFSWDGRLVSFVRTLAARPDLAALVKRIYIHCYLLQAIAEKEAESVPEMVGMLLALVPNLERLSFLVEGGDGNILARALPNLTTSSALKPRPLIKLDALDICDRSLDFSYGHHTSSILEGMAGISTFGELNLHMYAGTTLQLQKGSLQNLSAVRITHSRLATCDLASLFGSIAVPGLKSFVYEATHPNLDLSPCWGPSGVEFVGANHFQPSDLVQHLGQHKTTLQSLHVDLRANGTPCTTDEGSGGDVRPLSKTLKEFTALRDVFISASMLYNHYGRATYTTYDRVLLTDLLPPTVASLHLAGTLWRCGLQALAHALLYLAKQSGPRKRFRSLQHVRCDTVQALGGLSDYPIGEAFAASGVDFGYRSWPLSEPTLHAGERTPCNTPLPVDWSETGCNIPLPDQDDDL